MKIYKTIKKNLISALAGLSSVFLLSSCDGVIFDTIRDEVKLADAEITGDIQNIVRYTLNEKEHIFVSTGQISYRDIDGDLSLSKVSFSDFSTPSGFVYSLAADSTNLYALSLTIEKDDDGYNVGTERNLYCYDGSGWTKIWTASYDSTSSAILFSTNTPKPANRKAYFRTSKNITVKDESGNDTTERVPVVYELNGTTALFDDDGNEAIAAKYLYKTSTSYPVGTLSDTAPSTTTQISNTLLSAYSCAYFNGSVYFSSAYAMATNETLESEATYIYYSSGDNVYYSTDASTWTSVDLGCDVIYSMALTSDYLLAGTDSGIVHTALKADSSDAAIVAIPSTGNADFSTNADSTLSSYYEVPSVLVIDPAKTETDATIFASAVTSSTSASLGNVGLWSYFASTGEWNRE